MTMTQTRSEVMAETAVGADQHEEAASSITGEIEALLSDWLDEAGVGDCLRLAAGTLVVVAGIEDERRIEQAANIADTAESSPPKSEDESYPNFGDLFAQVLS